MKFRKSILTLALCGAVGPNLANAVDLSQISINGFGSVIAGITTDDTETIYGQDDSLTFNAESRFALQVGAPIGEKWSATAQIMARGADNYSPAFEWAYIGYQANDNLKILFGRQRFKLYKYSDYVDVGYAYPWLRPPRGVYSLPFSSGDGIGAVYSTYSGNVEMTFGASLIGFQNREYIPSGTNNLLPAELDLKPTPILNADFNIEALNFGINAGFPIDLNYDIEGADPRVAGLLAGLAGAGVGNDVLDDIRAQEDSAQSVGVYIGYDPGPFFVLAEFTDFQYDPGPFADTQSWYVSGGIRMNATTFYMVYGADENEASSDADTRLGAVGAAPLPGGGGATLAQGVRALLNAQGEDSETWSVGARWDVETGIAVKADFTSYTDDLDPTGDADVFAVGIDFVF